MALGIRAVSAALSALLILAPAAAQAPAPAPDPAQQKAQAAFEALPEAERRQIQLDLTFATEFSGAALGTFGPLTFRALLAFERQNRSQADAILDVPERGALAAAARRERERLGFRQVADAATKATIGLPTLLLPRAEPQAPGGARWQSADGKATVAMRNPAPAEGALEQLYEKALVSSNPQRKVTYKLLRPDFYVVAGETPQGKFYQRMAKLPDGSLRGFSVAYDKTLAPVWDKMTVAAANSFNPAGPPAGPAVAGVPAGAPAGAAPRPAAPPPPPDPFAPRRFERSLTALVVAPGRALTAAAAFRACPQPRLGGQPARLVAEDAASGLALIQADNLAAPPLAAMVKSATGPVAILAPGAGPDGGRTLLVVGGELGATLSAPLQPGAAGAPILGAEGLAGLVVGDPSARVQVAGLVLTGRHRIADAAAVSRFLAAQGVLPAVAPSAPAAASGGLAARHGRSVVAVACAP